MLLGDSSRWEKILNGENFLWDFSLPVGLDCIVEITINCTEPSMVKFYSVWLFWIENQDLQYVAIIMTKIRVRA